MNDTEEHTSANLYTGILSPPTNPISNSYANTTTDLYGDLNDESFSIPEVFDDFSGEDILRMNPNYKRSMHSEPQLSTSQYSYSASNKENIPHGIQNNPDHQNLKSKSSILKPKQIKFSSIPKLNQNTKFNSPIHQSTPNVKKLYESNQAVNVNIDPFNDPNNEPYITIKKSDYLRTLQQNQQYKQEFQNKENAINTQFLTQLTPIQNQLNDLKINDVNISNKVEKNKIESDKVFEVYELSQSNRYEFINGEISSIKNKLNKLTKFINESNFRASGGEISYLNNKQDTEVSLIDLDPTTTTDVHSSSAKASSKKSSSNESDGSSHNSNKPSNSEQNGTQTLKNDEFTGCDIGTLEELVQNKQSSTLNNSGTEVDGNANAHVNAQNSPVNKTTTSNVSDPKYKPPKKCVCGANEDFKTQSLDSSSNFYATCTENTKPASVASDTKPVHTGQKQQNHDSNAQNENDQTNLENNTSDTTISDDNPNIIINQEVQQTNKFPNFETMKYNYPLPIMKKDEENLKKILNLSNQDLQFIAKHLISSLFISIDDFILEIFRIGKYITISSNFLKKLHSILKQNQKQLSVGKCLKGQIMNNKGEIDNDLDELNKCLDSMIVDVSKLVDLKSRIVEKKGKKVRID
ncbi:uncharacterized protein KGF55_002383 [Candida pseudojiufengensis]|uniref:uncharacterized protein n=1 Tax=Candida pseudojiufengensis TaxID=497109 RepID=UPI0022253897|nr:uncharacterized protein KGF55_002383 [Candida pseudojiufengensis]KAI5963503.1 hypothetical protein KGF55_002383 [Candida pseudojiufengensis]